ncbi:hypothetical protein JXA05_01515 [Candidatus Peregrinibacteria bacterium]|nr:hypothetical protein [Candidatus Peregrinibacteria bacterium]
MSNPFKIRRIKSFFIVLCAALVFIGISHPGLAAAKTAFEVATETAEARQEEVKETAKDLKEKVDALSMGNKKEQVKDLLKEAEARVKDFTGLDVEKFFEKNGSANADYTGIYKAAEQEAVTAIAAVHRKILEPDRPGGEEGVPAGDIVTDFIPGIIRQLFRFAWLGIFITLTISGIYMVISFDNEEKLTKARQMIYYSLVGFAFVSLAFAIVKAVTDIDFFRFI